MKFSEYVEFKRDHFYNGAVQSGWFYDDSKLYDVASSFVFHGPKYFGVSSRDLEHKEHRLVDTASYISLLSQKVYSSDDSNRFMLTIASYGAGKSHLAVALSGLFSGHDARVREKVINNIIEADYQIGERLKKEVVGENLVITINGMLDFDLNYEILNCAKKALTQHNVSLESLTHLTKAHETAKFFLENNFESQFAKFCEEAIKTNRFDITDRARLYRNLWDGIETDKKAYEVINEVYKSVTGNYIKWDEGISAGEVLTHLCRMYCTEMKRFHKIIICFDEFGRYLEYAAAHPTAAGDAALQQIFEAIQNAEGKILFSGFIQSELAAYIRRVEKDSNITRYIGRYEGSEKFRLSTNFETILANFLGKKEPNKYERVVGSAMETTLSNYHSRLFENIKRWVKPITTKMVWLDKDLYQSVILKGAFPFHPLTIYMFSILSVWMQQRSTLTFVADLFDASAEETDGDWFDNYIYPTRIVESKLFDELLSAEERGLQKSIECTIYNNLMTKHGSNLTLIEKRVVQGILITQIGNFSFLDKADASNALKYCTGLKEADIKESLDRLEHESGFIYYNSKNQKYEILEDYVSVTDFRRCLGTKRLSINNKDLRYLFDDTLQAEMDLKTDIETSFAQEKGISSTEWRFAKDFIGIELLDAATLGYYLREFESVVDNAPARGRIVFVYCTSEDPTSEVRLRKDIARLELDKWPIIFIMIYDFDKEIKNALYDRAALQKFSDEERQKFAKFYTVYYKDVTNKMVKRFHELSSERNVLTAAGVNSIDMRMAQYCNETFKRIYPFAVPFNFDGFEKKTLTKAKQNLDSVCKIIYNYSGTKRIAYSTLSTEEKNRINGLFNVSEKMSWRALENERLFEPMNEEIGRVYRLVKDTLESGNIVSGKDLFARFIFPPYGMSYFSVILFAMYFVAYNGSAIRIGYSNEKINIADMYRKIVGERNYIKALFQMRFKMDEIGFSEEFERLCDEIERNEYMENCEELQEKLISMTNEGELSPENIGRKSELEQRLINGSKDYRNIIAEITAVEKEYERVIQKASIFTVVKLASSRETFENRKISGGYRYSLETKTRIKNAFDKVDRFLDQNYKNMIGRVSCEITQLSQCRNQFRSISELLSKMGKEEIVNALASRMEELEDNCTIQHKYGAVLSEISMDLRSCDEVESFSYLEAGQKKRVLENRLKFVEELVDISDKKRTELSNSIKTIMSKLEKRMEEEEARYRLIIGALENAGSISEARGAIVKAENMLNRELPNQYREIFKDRISRLVNLVRRIEALEPDKLSNQEIDSKFRELFSTIDNPTYTRLVKYCQEEIEKKQDQLNKSWYEKYISPIKANSILLNFDNCYRWINETKYLPKYLNNSNVCVYRECRVGVEYAIREYRIESILKTFNELSDEEKHICLSKLKMTYSHK